MLGGESIIGLAQDRGMLGGESNIGLAQDRGMLGGESNIGLAQDRGMLGGESNIGIAQPQLTEESLGVGPDLDWDIVLNLHCNLDVGIVRSAVLNARRKVSILSHLPQLLKMRWVHFVPRMGLHQCTPKHHAIVASTKHVREREREREWRGGGGSQWKLLIKCGGTASTEVAAGEEARGGQYSR